MCLPASPATLEPATVGAGQRNGLDALVGDHVAPRAAELRRSVWNTPAGKPARRKISSSASAQRDTLEACLRSPTLPAIERRGGEAHHLPEREVPRHHCEYRPERQVADVALVGVGLDRLVGEEARAMVGEDSGKPRRISALRPPRPCRSCPFPRSSGAPTYRARPRGSAPRCVATPRVARRKSGDTSGRFAGARRAPLRAPRRSPRRRFRSSSPVAGFMLFNFMPPAS